MGTATGCHMRVSGEDAAFHGLSAGLFTFIIRDLFLPCQIDPFVSLNLNASCGACPSGSRSAAAGHRRGKMINEVPLSLYCVTRHATSR